MGRTTSILLFFLLTVHQIGFTQPLLYIEGKMHVQSGGLLHVEGDVESADGVDEECVVELKGEIKVEGDWTNHSPDGVFPIGYAGTTAFVGGQQVQQIKGAFPIKFPHLKIDKPFPGGELRLLTQTYAFKSLDLTDDVLDLRGSDFILSQSDPGSLQRTAGISPPFLASSSGGYITSSGGAFSRFVAPDHNGEFYLFPMGSGVRFRPVGILPQVDSVVLARVQFVDQPPPNPTSLLPDLASVNPNWYHHIQIGPETAWGNQIRIYYDPPTDDICNTEQVSVAQLEDGFWNALSPTENEHDAPYLGHAEIKVDSSYQGPELALAGLQLVTGLPSCVFPPDRLVLDAQALENSIELSWVTDVEASNDYFYLERSTNGSTFIQIHSRPATGIQSPQAYQHEDWNAVLNQRYFYRVRQTDQNGGTRSSNVVEAILTEGGAAILGDFYPNPTNGLTQLWISLEHPDRMDIQVFSALGQEVLNQTWDLDAGYQVLDFNFVSLAKGVYFAVLNIDGIKSLRRLVVD